MLTEVSHSNPMEGCSWPTPTQAEAQGCTLHGHLGGTLEDCQEAQGMGIWQAVFSPLLPSLSTYQLMERVSCLGRGFWLLRSMQFMICPFPRLSSVPSGQCSGRHQVGEGLKCRLQRGGEEGGTGEGNTQLTVSG